MSRIAHTYGPTCHLGPSVAFSGCSRDDADIPHLKAHYFYSSAQPIDDPLSIVPIPSGPDPKSANHLPRPFSAFDNNALEEAWASIRLGKEKSHMFKKKSKSPSIKVTTAEHSAAVAAGSTIDAVAESTHATATAQTPSFAVQPEKHEKSSSHHADGKAAARSHIKNSESSTAQAPIEATSHGSPSNSNGDSSHDSHCPKLNEDHAGDQDEPVGYKNEMDMSRNHQGETFQAEAAPLQGNPYNPKSDDAHYVAMDSGMAAGIADCCAEFEHNVDHAPCVSTGGASDTPKSEELASTKGSKSEKDKSKRKVKSESESHNMAAAQGDAAGDHDSIEHLDMLDGTSSSQVSKGKSKQARSALTSAYITEVAAENPVQDDAGLTGRPFLKMTSRIPETSNVEDGEMTSMVEDEPNAYSSNDKRDQRGSNDSSTVEVCNCKAHKKNRAAAEVPVGVSRLHMVTMPALQMTPIYWSSVHDIAKVTRGTWFYKETMYPVEPPVANQLEIGYRELRPWSQTWSDELSSAMEVGAIGEEKIAHKLWPKDTEQQGKSRKAPQHILYDDPYCAAKCFQGEAAAEGSIDPEEPSKKPEKSKTTTKKYSSAQVIYKDAQNAFILKPALQPSAYYGRKPLTKIKKGAAVGIHIVRGFDWKLWYKLHPNKKSAATSKAEQNAPVAGDADVSKGTACPACKAHEELPKVTDLILVIHGIGQKLSERMESFNFTHAINGFRRSINAELANDAVHGTLRQTLGGVMVLPINWRSNLSFEDGGPRKQGDKVDDPDFTLKDITPESIPAVRNIISDVMLDIPFYMSHHKPKMLRAAVTEANRVYQLWCKNNPEFHGEGRVHIIAHSLGSAMALEMLSRQPTVVPKFDPHAKKVNAKHLDFNTTNLFLCGSPAGFFLLLDKGRLIPRRAQGKPGADGHDDVDKGIVGEVGTFGCLAVDNIYNIMHVNDPIAYKLNAAVDPGYAASIRNAQVPSATTGFFESIGNVVRSITPGVAGPQDLAVGQLHKPAVARLPSQLEMEVHNFTREELAEKKFYLVNDCGQVDWFLTSGGGPLEIQYLNMLSAHSSYWGSPDFIRFIVIEVGRNPGKDNVLPNMRVAKIGRKDIVKKS